MRKSKNSRGERTGDKTGERATESKDSSGERTGAGGRARATTATHDSQCEALTFLLMISPRGWGVLSAEEVKEMVTWVRKNPPGDVEARSALEGGGRVCGCGLIESFRRMPGWEERWAENLGDALRLVLGEKVRARVEAQFFGNDLGN